jgi:hypothetical protein
MNTMVQTFAGSLEDLFSPLMLVAISIVTEKIRNFVLTKVQRGIHDTPGRKARLQMIFMMATEGSFNVLWS